MKSKRIFFLFSTVFFLAPPSKACDFCMLGQGISPYLTAQGRGLTYKIESLESEQIYNNESPIESNGKKEFWLLQSLTGFQSVSEDLNLSVSLSYATKTNIDYDSGTNTNPGTLTKSLGDTTLSARYTFFKHHNLESTFLSGVILGLKIPTGATDLKSANGVNVDRHALPGTGSYDEIVSLTSSFAQASGTQITGDITYNFSGKGRLNSLAHQYGDSFILNLKAYRRISSPDNLNKNIFIFTGPSYQVSGKEKGVKTDSGYLDNSINESSGGKVGFWDIGVYATFEEAYVVSLSYGKALYHSMNWSANFDADPAENERVSSSLTFLF